MNADRDYTWSEIGAALIAVVIGLGAVVFGVYAIANPDWLDPRSEYVVDFGGSIHDPLPIIVVTSCTQQPHNDAEYRAYCDRAGRQARVVTPQEWDQYHMGSPVKEKQ